MRNNRKKTNAYLKLAMITLISAAAGAVFGFAMFWFVGGGEAEPAIRSAYSRMQTASLPVMAAITVLAVAAGEIYIRKLKDLNMRMLHADDEECDALDYEEEKAGAVGMNISILVQGSGLRVSFLRIFLGISWNFGRCHEAFPHYLYPVYHLHGIRGILAGTLCESHPDRTSLYEKRGSLLQEIPEAVDRLLRRGGKGDDLSEFIQNLYDTESDHPLSDRDHDAVPSVFPDRNTCRAGGSRDMASGILYLHQFLCFGKKEKNRKIRVSGSFLYKQFMHNDHEYKDRQHIERKQ